LKMLSFQRIICPTDFSEASYVALATAVEMATQFGAELCLLHVVEFPHGPYGTELGFTIDTPQQEREMLNTTAHELYRALKERVPETVKARPLVKIGVPTEEIVHAARQEAADLIVMSTHGLTGWRHLVLGSVAEKVVQTAPCAVLTVHAPANTTPEPGHEDDSGVHNQNHLVEAAM
jgi:universal stress protein A